ncbi:MAG: carbohydrate ABC transporter permease [Clostridia bacterium]|nr:carbohydrate ABC transporter permease [Clostridia bacterium]
MINFPFWLLISASLSDANVLAQQGYQIWPKPVDFSSYIYIFKNPGQILNAYGVTFTFSVVSMILSVLLTAMIAYPLSRKHLRGRNIINFYLYFTMLFSGGLVPTYLVVAKYLHLDDTIWVYILPGAVSAWNVFMMRTFFSGIPGEIIESAKVDGASEYKIFATMIIPLSKPVIATIGLMIFLSKWNDWNTALIYITEPKLYSLQYLLQSIMEDINMLKQNPDAAAMMQEMNVPSETIRMAMAVVVAGPALVVFPFFQKYFVKGLTVGSVKG